MHPVEHGERVGEYILEERLGRGSFGEVWAAQHHMWSHRRVAIKIPTSPEALRVLRNEGLVQASLDHPGIAATIGMDLAAEPPYFVTEYVDGCNLRKLLEDNKGPLTIEKTTGIILDLLCVLEYAHDLGVVHQDIKPENILIAKGGQLKLTDFGLAHEESGPALQLSASLASAEGVRGGTLAYIAPELHDTDAVTGPPADIYSVGIVFFELLTGRRPVGPEVPSDLAKELPSWCDEFFRKACARVRKRPVDGHQARKLLSQLSARPDAPTTTRAKPGPRRMTPAERAALAASRSEPSFLLVGFLVIATCGVALLAMSLLGLESLGPWFVLWLGALLWWTYPVMRGRCPSCRRLVRLQSRFCRFCGVRIPPSKLQSYF